MDGAQTFIEALGDAASGKWLIRVIRAGASLNNNYYPDAALREAVPLFNNSRVFSKTDAEHIKGDGKSVANLIGRLVEAQFVPGATADSGQIQAVLEMIEPEGAVAVKIREAVARGMPSLFGFSVDAVAATKTETREGRRMRVATAFKKISSVDLIVEPGAGGELIRMVEAITPLEESEMSLRQMMLDEIKAKKPAAHAALGDAASDAEITAAYREAVAAPELPGGGLGYATGTGDVAEAIRMVEARADMRTAIAASNLPQPAKDRLLADFGGRERFVEADVAAAISTEREYLARFTESGHVNLNFGEGVRAEE